MGKDLKGKEIGKGFSQRKDGRYNARAVINGITINLYGMKLPQLRKEFDEEKAKILREEFNIRPNVTLNEWFEEWFTCVKSPMLKGEVNRANYRRKIRNTYGNLLGEKRLKDISQINIQTAANELIDEKGYSIRYVREVTSCLREILNSAVANRLIPFNPCLDINIKELNQPREERVVLTFEEQEQFLSVAKEQSFYYEAYKILLLTGMRAGEFAGLQWSDINFKDKYIQINRSLTSAYLNGKKILEFTTPKTINSYRKIPFFGETEKLLKAWKAKQDECKERMGNRWRCPPLLGDLVFTTTLGSPATRYILKSDIDKILKTINMSDIYIAAKEGREPRTFKSVHPHAFRHTFATRCFEKDLEPLFIMKVMGHTNYATTVSYTHILDGLSQSEIEKAGSFFQIA
jgi:integrase